MWINFSALSGPLGSVLRASLKAVPRGLEVPIVQGPLRGARWIAGASNHGCWLGSFELEVQARAARLVKPGAVVYDVGAHVGFFTLLFARLVGPDGLVAAVEPAPRSLRLLERHLAINRVSNSVVTRAAAWDTTGTVRFVVPTSPSKARVTDDGDIEVPSVRLDELVASGLRAPDCLKIDVEGAEERVLRGARGILSEYRPTILLETHGESARTACVALLSDLGYVVRAVANSPRHIVAVRPDLAYPSEFAGLDLAILDHVPTSKA